MSIESKWESLTDEQKEKVKACASGEELAALAASEGIELTDEELEAASGGEMIWGGVVNS